MIGEMFLRQIPAALQAGYQNGALTIHGSTLRHANGQIAGFLQETSGLSKIAEAITRGPMSPLKFVGDTITVVQNEQIKGGIARLEQGVAMLNQLGVANVALGAAGIGVSAVGFIVMSRKIDGLTSELRSLGDKLDQLQVDVRDIDLKAIADRMAQLRGLARSIDGGWLMSDGGARINWRDNASEARRLNNFFEGRAEQVLLKAPLAVDDAAPLLDAGAMASSLRVGALALSGETAAAINVAQEDAERLQRLTGGIGAADLVRARLASSEWIRRPGSEAAGEALITASAQARSTARTLRSREAVAATRAAPLISLREKGVNPREWLAAARAEEETPLLFMAY